MTTFSCYRRLHAVLALSILVPCIAALRSSAQTAGFTAPDTVFAGQTVNIVNTSTGGSTWYWSFDSGAPANDPTGVNIGNPGNLLSIPTYITLVKQGNDCFSFISCQGVGVIRYYHGTSFSHNPVSWTNLGTFGLINFNEEGIQVKNENGTWYGFVNNDGTIIRLNFGNSLWNTPTATDIGPFPAFNMAHGLYIVKEGTTWIGFVTCSIGQKMLRLDFGASLANIPSVTDFGNMGGILISPGAISFVQENSLWYALVMAGGNTLARISFGTSLLNTPTGVSLGNPGGFNLAIGLTLIRDCSTTTGYWCNYLVPGELGKLTFPTGVLGQPAGTVLGNIGGLARPHSFSEIFRQHDTLFCYVTDRDNGTLTRLTFAPGGGSTIPSSTQFTPPPYSYSQPGTYYIRMIMNEGMFNEQSVCKPIVVINPPVIAAFTAPDTVCVGQPVNITNQSTPGLTYYWSFCSGNALANPVGTNIGNPGNLLTIPCYITLVRQGGICYSFITTHGTNRIVRYNHGASFSNAPASWTTLAGPGTVSDTVQGIRVKYDNGQWIGIVNDNNRILHFNFGNSPGNTPTITISGPYSMLYSAHGLEILKEGNTWIGFIACTLGNKFVRLNFGNSLMNNPVPVDLGVPGGMNMPSTLNFVNENGQWYALVVNYSGNTLTRLSFGGSLLNMPIGVNLGTPCPGIIPSGTALVRDCENTSGFQLNGDLSGSPNTIWRLNFPSGITGPVTGTPLGNIGTMSQPLRFSELFRVGDTLFLYNTNRLPASLTRLEFLPCTNAFPSSSTLFNPPPFTYNAPGVYNIQLIVNEGLPNQASICRKIVVVDSPCSAVASFTCPDTVCVGAPVNITNQSTSGGSYYWNFCSGNAGANPVASNIGNPGNKLNLPVYITLVQDGTDCYSFVTNHGSPTHITRNYHGSSFRNNPVSSTNILETGIVHQFCEAIQIRKENGNWYGFFNNNSTILRINFGASITNNSPTTTDIGPFPNIAVAHGLVLVKEGAVWLGFFDSSDQNKLFRLNFGTSLTNLPVLTDFGNLAGFGHPCQIAAVKENGTCYLMTVNSVGNTLSRISFGTSYLNAPTGENLGNCGALASPVGITLLNECETTTGYYTVFQASPTAAIGRLTFSGGAGGQVTAQSLGNVGTLHYPSAFSELFRQNDSLFAYVPNEYSSSLTRFSFPPCTNASIPSSTLYTPPPFSYNQPGTYNVQLIVNEGLPSQASLCRNIVVVPPPVVSLGNDRQICPGTTTILDAGTGFQTYLWSTGATTQAISVAQTGNYWVKVTKNGCEASDSVNVSNLPVVPVNLGPDPTVCEGQLYTFNAGNCPGCTYAWSNLTLGFYNIGNGPTYTTGIPGVYAVQVTNPNGCLSGDTVQLFTNPVPSVAATPPALAICSGQQAVITLSSPLPGTQFSWTATSGSPAVTGFSPGTGPVISQVLYNSSFSPQTVIYHITPFTPTCAGIPVDYIVTVKPLPDVSVTPSSQSVCNGGTAAFTLSSGVAGAAFSWTAQATSPSVTGYSPGNGLSVSQVLFNTGITVDTVFYSIEATSAGCSGTIQVYSVPVIPTPGVTASPPSPEICSGSQAVISLASPVPGAGFTWTVTVSSPSVTGWAPGSGNVISQVLTSVSDTIQTVIYHVTPYLVNCAGTTIDCPVIVKPIPEVAVNPPSTDLCSGATATVRLSSGVAGATFSWTVGPVPPYVTGYAPGAGPVILQTLVNSGMSPGQVNYLVTASAGGCPGPFVTCPVMVNPVPAVIADPPQQVICSGNRIEVELMSLTAGTSFSWTVTAGSAAVTGCSPGSGSHISQVVFNASGTDQTVIYHITPRFGNCPGSLLDYPVLVRVYAPEPGMVDTTLCHGSRWYAGGAWQSTDGNYYDTIRAPGKCDSVCITTLHFRPAIPVDLGTDSLICNGVPVLLRTGVKADRYEWQDGSEDSVYLAGFPGICWVEVTVDGCTAGDSIAMTACTKPLWFPNLITPNGDGFNETFHPVGEGIIHYHVAIFDRWGIRVHDSDAMLPGWDGTYAGKDCATGTYYYIATYQLDESNGETYTAQGSITLLR